jgi:preprotein translocase subunit YajC
MEPLFVVVVTFGLLWVFFILPRQRQVRAHQQLVASLDVGDEVILTAGIYGRIVELGPDDVEVEVAPGVQLRVARQAVLRRVELPETVDAVDTREPAPDRDAGPDDPPPHEPT